MKRKDTSRDSAVRQSVWKGLLLVLVAAVTLEATSLIQTYFAQKGLEEEAGKRAEMQLEKTRSQILDVIDQAETVIHSNVWITRWCLNLPDSLPRLAQRIVEENHVIVGSTIALLPGYSSRRPYYAPYAYNDADSVALISLATKEYDYPSKEWFTLPVSRDSSFWSEPYVDTGGGGILMTTYSVPVRDQKGKMAAVLTGDISLDWLSDLLGNIQIYPHATALLISRAGRFMVSQTNELILQKTIREVVDELRDDEDFKALNQAMLHGESGYTEMTYKGVKSHIYYAPIERTGWSMCVVIPDDDIYGGIRHTRLLVELFQLLGLAILSWIIYSLVKSQLKNRDLNEKKSRIDRDLHIANDIQMSMIPRALPSFQERDELEIAADIVPAKEVGGDLYDYYLRDGKLFFCIGDVSGKGIAAALVMAVTRTSFRSVSAHENDPDRIVSAMNNSMSEMNENNMFVTFFCGVLDLGSGLLRYCNAGHNPPFILTDSIGMLPVQPNLPLGILPEMVYTAQELKLSYDDALFLYTDGLTEAENRQHELFGEERAEAALHGRKNAWEHLKNLQNRVSAFVADAPQSDDLTMLFIHYLGREKVSLTLDNDIREISRLSGFVDEATRGKDLDPTLIANLNLALEEAVTNVILYAYPEGAKGKVDIEASIKEKELRFTVSDSGKAFDPTQTPEPDLTVPLLDRPIGGLGIHLVRSIMDSVGYKREDGKNILMMTKKLQ